MELLIFLIIGTILMTIVMLYIRKYYGFVRWKVILSAVCLTITGVTGASYMFFIESGHMGGVSFYGALFFAPVVMAVLAAVLRIPVGRMLDICAPAECIMLALLKIRCIYFDCCNGIVLYETEQVSVRFPSQVTELITALCIMFVLIRFIKENRYENQIYAWYMVIYGATRFVLNAFRETTPFVWILPAGSFWSIISVIVGTMWILAIRFYTKKRNDNHQEINE